MRYYSFTVAKLSLLTFFWRNILRQMRKIAISNNRRHVSWMFSFRSHLFNLLVFQLKLIGDCRDELSRFCRLLSNCRFRGTIVRPTPVHQSSFMPIDSKKIDRFINTDKFLMLQKWYNFLELLAKKRVWLNSDLMYLVCQPRSRPEVSQQQPGDVWAIALKTKQNKYCND